MIVDIIVLVLLLLISFALYKGYGASVIEFFSILPKHKRKQVDMVAMSKFLGKVFFGGCGCVALFIAGEISKIFWITVAGLVILVGLSVFAYFYMHSSKHFNK